MPNAVLSQIQEYLNIAISNITGVEVLDVTNAEMVELATKLEEMGYDLEAYGFVEEITRTGEYTYQDTEFENNKPTRGTIKSIKSKYLEAYLIAEKKSYIIANPDYVWYQKFFRGLLQIDEI